MVNAKITIGGQELELPTFEGTEGEKAVDISKLRATTGYVAFDPGFANTSPATSEITFLNGEQGILRYRGYTIADLCSESNYEASSFLSMKGHLPKEDELKNFNAKLLQYRRLPAGLEKIYDAYPQDTHPMIMVSAVMGALSAYYPEFTNGGEDSQIEEASYIAMGSMLTAVAFSYRKSKGLDFVYSDSDSTAVALLQMMFGLDYDVDPDVVKVIDELLILHIDHEFNCSTSTVRLVGSSQANLFAAISAGVMALWGPLHGGANQAVVEMLLDIDKNGFDPKNYLEKVKNKEAGIRLMGFGHRVYKNYDPRARIIKKTCHKVIEKMGQESAFLNIARELEQAALDDEYFTSRKLYPNVDFYSGIIYRAIGIPVEMFTPLFALGRVPGWAAHYTEQHADAKARIGRPRQIYTGENEKFL